jgi:Fe-S cluster biogenesis protein NfuA
MYENMDKMLYKKIEKSLSTIRPAMEADGGGLELVSLEENTLTIRMIGTCVYCPSQSLTKEKTILPTLRKILPSKIIVKII